MGLWGLVLDTSIKRAILGDGSGALLCGYYGFIEFGLLGFVAGCNGVETGFCSGSLSVVAILECTTYLPGSCLGSLKKSCMFQW
jgi:hypothetical protein